MSCQKNPKERRVALALLRRLHRILLVQEIKKKQLNVKGLFLLRQGVFATILDLADLGHGKAALWYIRRGPFGLRSGKFSPEKAMQFSLKVSLPQETKNRTPDLDLYVARLKAALKVYLDARNGRAYTSDGHLISLGGRDLKSYQDAALKRLRTVTKQMISRGFREEAEEIFRFYGLDIDIDVLGEG
jgi:hypothetical protein